jgi:TolA-binding protein
MRLRLLACASAAFLGGCAVAPEDDPVMIRLNDLDQRVQRIERVLTNQSLLELAKRIDDVQGQLRQMRGEVELLQNQSEGGKNQTRSLYSDLEKRLAALETLGGIGGPGAAGGVMPVAPGAGGMAAGGAGEQASYDAAFNALKGSDFPKAISGFRNFVATYPSSPLASNAQYWLARRTT